jgi:hypothetical protein
MQVKVRDLHPNPFRHMARYPIRREKVDALKESLRKTGFWDNVVARQQDGRVEIAYGHHRLVALQEEYGPDREVSVILRDLDDTKMLQIMANENMEEWGNSAWVEMETVSAVIQAYDEGRIVLDQPNPRTKLSGMSRSASGHLYTPVTVANFLGWHDPSGNPSYKVTTAIEALDLIFQGVLSEADFAGLGTTQVTALVQQTRRVLRDNEAKRLQAEADAAHKAAVAAAKQRERAEAEQQAQARAAQQAENEARRAEANRKRIEAEREAEQARRREAEARRREEADRERAAEQERKGREAASKVGKHVSEGLRSGETTYKQAAARAEEVMAPRDTILRPMDAYALRVARAVSKLLVEDKLRREVDELLRLRDQLTAQGRVDLVVNLRAAAQRFEAAAKRFAANEADETAPSMAPTAPALVG